jgi:hypothetical protein
MSQLVCYIPSFNDSDLVSQSLASSRDWNVVISDNASDEPHARALAALAGDRVKVIRHQKNLGRVGNWKLCVNHFIESGATWMKFLLAGDRHKPGAVGAFERAMAEHPAERIIIGRVECYLADGQVVVRPTDEPVLARVLPHEAMYQVALNGNVFFGLQAPLIHVDALRDGFQFGEGILSYCADLLFLMSIAEKLPCLYIPEVIAEFVAQHRKHFSAGQQSLEHYVEEGLMRLRAADYYMELTGDRQERNRLVASIRSWMAEGLARLDRR